MITTAQAITSLRPHAEWSMNGDDVENIIWHTEGVTPLTMAEVKAEKQRLEAQALANSQAEAMTRAAAIDHAKSLGFTDQMIEVMYPNLGAQL